MDIKDLSKLNFVKLNDNDCDVWFRILTAEKFGFVSEDKWSQAVQESTDKGITLTDWRLIDIAEGEVPLGCVLLGSMSDGEYVTSPVINLAPDLSAATTRSGSLYKLCEPGTDNPTLSQLLMLVFMLRRCGMGSVVKGWPDVFF